MNTINFKYYPKWLLLWLIGILTILIEIARRILIQNQQIEISELLWPLANIGIVTSVVYFINKYTKFNWFFKIMGLTNMNGEYEGILISSYHEDDDPSKPHIRMKMSIKIVQNINDIKVFGSVNPLKGDKSKTSNFSSLFCQLTKSDDGTFFLDYGYGTIANKSHSWDAKYTLTSHQGWAHLVYHPENKTLEGYYATYENQSRGNIVLKKI